MLFNNFSPYPRSRINLYTRIQIAMHVLLIAGKACNKLPLSAGKNMQCCMLAYGRK
jgi:hypothetical protein